MKDPYAALGVARTADAAEIKRAYRKLTTQYHPDKNPGDKAAEERFKEVSNAYEVVGDDEKRKLFDEFGELSLTQGFDPQRARAYQRARAGRGAGGFQGGYSGFPGGFEGNAREMDFNELLGRIFGGGTAGPGADPFSGRGSGRGAPRSTKGHDIQGSVTVSMMDSLLGVTVPLRIDSRGGEGRTIDVKVPPGVTDGQKLRIREQGGAGTPPGDLILTIHVQSSARISRDGQNLTVKVPVTLLEAYRGGPIDVPLPLGGTVTVRVPEGSNSGQRLRLRGKGLPARGEGSAGDLFVELEVVMPPVKGDAELLAALERLQSEQDPRVGLTY